MNIFRWLDFRIRYWIAKKPVKIIYPGTNVVSEAIATIPPDGGYICLLPGTYIQTESIVIPDSIKMDVVVMDVKEREDGQE